MTDSTGGTDLLARPARHEPKATDMSASHALMRRRGVGSARTRRDVYFRVPSFPGTGRCERPLEEMQQGEGDRRCPREGSPRTSHSGRAQEGEGTYWESLGRRRPAGTSSAQRWTDRCGIPSRCKGEVGFVFHIKKRDRADRGGARQALARTGAQRMVRWATRRWRVVGNIRICHGALEHTGATRSHCDVGAHYRKAVAYNEAPWRTPPARWRACETWCEADARAPGIDDFADRFFDALVTLKPPRRAPCCSSGCGANRRMDAGVAGGPGGAARCSTRSLETLIEADAQRPRLQRLAAERTRRAARAI